MENQEKRKYLGIKFDCCGVYSRVYFNDRLKAYLGRCPKCLRQLKILVDKEKGTNHRFFVAK